MPERRPELVVVGSGIAGLFVALRACEEGLRPLLLTKSTLTESNTRYAQGGIAAAVGDDDSTSLHYLDTLRAGAGLVDIPAARALAQEAPDRIRQLVRWGVPFDTVDGEVALGREAAHSRSRVLHAGGDATGLHIEETLQRKALEAGLAVREGCQVRTLLTRRGRVTGLRFRSRRGTEEVGAEAVVLATGGAGRLFRDSSNPAGATGEGVATAARAGAELRDMEFVQFHPTVFSRAGQPRFLLTEALRGEGAHLVDRQGERFMARYHPAGELAPRDVVSRAIAFELERAGGKTVFLDASNVPEERLLLRFPTVAHFLRGQGLDLARDPIPVAPMAHYMIGGVATGLTGQSSLPGLYACGEVASTGVHGANRLASNSLLEGLVFGERVVRALRARGPWRGPGTPQRTLSVLPSGSARPRPLRDDALGGLLADKVGILRDAQRLTQAVERLEAALASLPPVGRGEDPPLEADRTLTGLLIARGALAREESRGGHYRLDFPYRRARWKVHLSIRLGPPTAPR